MADFNWPMFMTKSISEAPFSMDSIHSSSLLLLVLAPRGKSYDRSYLDIATFKKLLCKTYITRIYTYAIEIIFLCLFCIFPQPVSLLRLQKVWCDQYIGLNSYVTPKHAFVLIYYNMFRVSIDISNLVKVFSLNIY